MLTEQMQEELDQKDRTIRKLKVHLDESLTLNERLNSENRACLLYTSADYTGIGRNTLRKLVEWKKLPVLKVGRRCV